MSAGTDQRRGSRGGRRPVRLALAAVAALGLAAGVLALLLGRGTSLVAASWALASVAAAGAVAVGLRGREDPVVPLGEPTGEVSERAAAAASSPVARRTVLACAGAAGAGGVLLAWLGPEAAAGTGWGPGVPLVTPEGRRLRPEDVPPAGMATVWPEGARESDNAAVVLVRLTALPQPPTVLDWVVGGTLVAYSKVCTHAGCAVGLFRTGSDQLYCPCHQAMFAAERGAVPTFGPAAVALPQLPLGVREDGYLVALGDFPRPVGPHRG